MPTVTAKIGHNPRGAWSATTADYTFLDTVTVTSGGATSLYEVISPAYPATVPAGTLTTNTTYYRLISSGATGATGATGALPVVVLTAVAYTALATKDTNTLYVIQG